MDVYEFDNYVTNITLAFFQDTGLFLPNYHQADYNFYG